jgi:outer membrane protein, heavy metal efflux system
MKQTCFRRVLIGAGVAFAAGLSGCATKPAPAPESWVEPRPLGEELVTFRPPRGATNALDRSPTIEEPAGALTLRQALALALARNPGLAVFSWDVRIGEARMLQAGLRPNPEVGVELENVLGTGEFRGAQEAETTLQLSQLIELGGKRAARVRAAKLERDLAGWDYETRRIDVFAKTAEAFVEVLSLQQRLALAEEMVRLAEEIVQAVTKRVDAARTFEVERTKAQVAVAAAQIERDQTERAWSAARQRLAANWDNTQPRFERVEGDLERLAAVPAQEPLLARLKQNPELARWATERLQREASLKLERSKAIPDVTLGGGYRRLSGPEDSALVFGVSVPLPLFNQNQGAIKEAEYRVAKAGEEQRATESRIATELGQAWQQVAAARAEIAAIKEKLLPGAQQTYTTLSQYYAEGRLSYLEVLDAQRTYFGARVQYYRALSGYHTAVIAIERLIGEPLTPAANTP